MLALTGMDSPAAKDPDELLTAKEVGERLKLRSKTTVLAVMKRIPGHVLIGVGIRPQVRVPRWALERWITAGGDRRPRSKPTGSQRRRSPNLSTLKEQFPGYNPARYRKQTKPSTRPDD